MTGRHTIRNGWLKRNLQVVTEKFTFFEPSGRVTGVILSTKESKNENIHSRQYAFCLEADYLIAQSSQQVGKEKCSFLIGHNSKFSFDSSNFENFSHVYLYKT